MRKSVQMALKELISDEVMLKEVERVSIVRETRNAIDYQVFNPDEVDEEEKTIA